MVVAIKGGLVDGKEYSVLARLLKEGSFDEVNLKFMKFAAAVPVDVKGKLALYEELVRYLRNTRNPEYFAILNPDTYARLLILRALDDIPVLKHVWKEDVLNRLGELQRK